ncbi:MAG: relaxase domain-containing protein [Solirubrobacteraceae bacterium]
MHLRGKLGQHRYYERQIAGGGDDYYSGRGEAPGEWAGSGAKALGLSGHVSAEQFGALIAGLDPRNRGVRLRASERDPKVAALDLTFSAPKSLSVLFAVSPEEFSDELVACHEEAVRAALLPHEIKPTRPRLAREDVLDVREVAGLLHMPLSTIFDYARRGLLPGRKLGRRWVFLRDELDATLRTAPRSASVSPAPQPPVSQRQKSAKQTVKRSPTAVPYDASGQQRLRLD